MPGSGKTYFGKMMAGQLKYGFVDTDELIIEEYFKESGLRMTCRELALKEGEPYFRLIERKILLNLDGIHHSVIALGGGALCLSGNISLVKNLGEMIYLKVAPQILFERLMIKKVLPSYIDPANIRGSFNALLKRRLPLYEQNCHVCIDANWTNVVEFVHAYANF